MEGYVNLCSIRDVINSEKSIILLMSDNLRAPIENVILLPDLAPSKTIQRFYEESPSDERWGLFALIYSEYLKNSTCIIAMQTVVEFVKQGYVVNLTCYCQHSARCFRGLLQEPFELMGVNVDLK